MLRLDGGGETLLLALGDGPPALAYWGPALPAARRDPLPSFMESAYRQRTAGGRGMEPLPSVRRGGLHDQGQSDGLLFCRDDR